MINRDGVETIVTRDGDGVMNVGWISIHLIEVYVGTVDDRRRQD